MRRFSVLDCLYENYLIQDTKRPGVPPETYIVCSFEKTDDEWAFVKELKEQFPNAILPPAPDGAVAFTRLFSAKDQICQLNIKGLSTDELMLFKLKWGLKNVII